MPPYAAHGLRELRGTESSTIARPLGDIRRTDAHGRQPVHRPPLSPSQGAHVIRQQAGAGRKLITGAQRAGRDIDDRARSRAIPHRKTAAVDVHAPDGCSIERTEQTLKVLHMKGIRQRHAVEFD